MSNTREPTQVNPVNFKSKFDENNVCSHQSWQLTVLSQEYGSTYLAVEGVTKENEIFANYYNLRILKLAPLELCTSKPIKLSGYLQVEGRL